MIVADQKWKDPRNPSKLLHLEMLAEWLAGKVGLPYLHVDPFKIDFAAVTKLMSTAYAQRYKILPVGVTAREATIATCEPFVRDWEESFKQVLRLEIKRVIANPLDIQNYIVEFFNLAKSVKGASEKDKGAYSEIAQLRAARAARHAAASSTPTISTSSTSATGCSTTRSSSARATSTSSRGATPATCASASTACCTRSIRSRRRCWRR